MKFYHDTEGFTHFKSSTSCISLQVVSYYPELHKLTNQAVLYIDFECHVIAKLVLGNTQTRSRQRTTFSATAVLKF